MFGEVICEIEVRRCPIHIELVLVDAIAYPIERISMVRERRWVTVSLARPTAVELSTKMGVGGWGWPSSSRVVRRGVASLVLWKGRQIPLRQQRTGPFS